MSHRQEGIRVVDGAIVVTPASGSSWASPTFTGPIAVDATTYWNGLLRIGGTTTQPALKASGNTLEVRNGSDNAYNSLVAATLQATGGQIFGASANLFVRWGTGSPEGAVTGSVGAMFLRTDGGAGTTLYVKESGSATNTGWVAMVSA